MVKAEAEVEAEEILPKSVHVQNVDILKVLKEVFLVQKRSVQSVTLL